jgi:hypothetical protein
MRAEDLGVLAFGGGVVLRAGQAVNRTVRLLACRLSTWSSGAWVSPFWDRLAGCGQVGEYVTHDIG